MEAVVHVIDRSVSGSAGSTGRVALHRLLQAEEQQVSHRGNWNVAVAGECMVCRPFSMHDDERFMGVIDLLRDSDVTYAHLEMNLGDWDEVEWPSKAEWMGSFMLADPVIADDLKWAGMDIMSLAHNHSFDFGVSGLLSTMRYMKEAGIAAGGIGRDLEEAREPVYLEKPKGRVAMVSISSGNKYFEWAGVPKAGMRGRPGVNPQRLAMKYMVPPEAAEQMKAIASELGVLRKKSKAPAGFGMMDDEFGFIMPGEQSMSGANAFVEGDHYEILSMCHQRDLEGNMRAIDEARTYADLVIVGHHFNVSEGFRGDHPPKFVREFAHAAIDAGADIYIGHGWHRTLGIEIYKGKPIVYGIGNFWAQSEFIRRVPYDSYEAWGHDVDKLQTLTPAAYPLHPGLDNPTPTWWSSAILRFGIEDGRLKRIELHPVDLGRDEAAKMTRQTGRGDHPATEGRPILAEGAVADAVIERYRKLSAEYGTEVRCENGIGVVEL